MTLAGQSSHGIPPDPRYVTSDEIKALWRAIQTLQTANPSQATTISEGGLQIFDSAGNLVAQLGQLAAPGTTPDPTDQGMALYRTDPGVEGTTALEFLGGFIGFRDASENIIVSDDIVSRQGMGRPYLSFGAWMDRTVPQTTTSATFTTIQTVEGRKTHPKIEGQYLLYSSDATTPGEVRITNAADGTQIGTTQAVGEGNFIYVPFGPFDLPGSNLARLTLNLQARRTGGNGSVGVRGTSIRCIESNPV